ncbi:LemA family protein [Flavobacterium sp. I3-2]|uniref:LemA family protein n=1 Tax=Flavobacterium sp. I3-2 TaxID=2748319 RepID=UPI0015A9BEC2|nr:LemA family protein [Flavobacterium sp. I3-2]
MTTTHYIIIGFSMLILLYIISMYNKLSTKKNQIQNAISSLDALFIQRADLIPNLIVTVKQYVTFEKETLEKITELRRPAAPTKNENPYVQQEEGSSTLKQIMIQVEDYPELKSNQQFNQLQQAFKECEEQIAAGRRFLSASITDYNDSIVVFPSNVIAGVFGFKKYEWQYATELQRTAPNANDLFNN